MLRTYNATEVEAIVRRYNAGDLAAQEQIRALAEQRHNETGESLADAYRAILRVKAPTPYSAPPETDPIKISDAGRELQSVAENIKATGRVVFAHGTVSVGKVNDGQALRLAILSNPILGAQYTGHEILPDHEAYLQVKRLYGDRSQRK